MKNNCKHLKNIFLNGVIAVLFTLLSPPFSAHAGVPMSDRPPVTPSWVFGHWVYDGGATNQAKLLNLVKEYNDHQIPVSAVIIDAPWESEYNNFIFDKKKFPNPKEMIDQLHEQGVRVVVWMTPMLNVANKQYEDEPTAAGGAYSEAKNLGHLCGGGETSGWWKGEGGFLDFTNPTAVEWWHSQMDHALKLGIDGFKAETEGAGATIPDGMKCSTGPITKKKYLELFYSDIFNYVSEHSTQTIALARAVDIDSLSLQGWAKVGRSAAIWTGDELHDRSGKGYIEALSDMFDSARLGFGVIGSDSGGYFGDNPVMKKLLLRWSQLSALTPFLVNGGFGNHKPWLHDEETVNIYRKFVKLHYELEPYLYSSMMESHWSAVPHELVFVGDERRIPIIREEGGKWQYRLGDNLFVSALYGPDDRRTVTFPCGKWYDFWNAEKEPHKEHETVKFSGALESYPLYVRQGSIVPLHVVDSELDHGDQSFRNAVTLDIYPGDDSKFYLFEEGRDVAFIDLLMMNDKDFRVIIPAGDRRFMLRTLSYDKPDRIRVNGACVDETNSLSGLGESPLEWYYDKDSHRIYVNPGPGDKLVVEVFYSPEPDQYKKIIGTSEAKK